MVERTFSTTSFRRLRARLMKRLNCCCSARGLIDGADFNCEASTSKPRSFRAQAIESAVLLSPEHAQRLQLGVPHYEVSFRGGGNERRAVMGKHERRYIPLTVAGGFRKELQPAGGRVPQAERAVAASAHGG